ncbi:MAG TPA: sensor histidine kinase [Trueperaceae bacterium]
MSWRAFTIPKRSLVWLVYLATLLFQPAFDSTATWEDWALTGLIVLAFLPVYGWTERYACDRPYFWRGQPGGLLGIAIMLAMAVFLAPLNAGTSVFFIYAAATGAIMRPRRIAVGVVAATFLLVPVAALLAVVPFPYVLYPYVPSLIFVPIIGIANYHQREREEHRARLAMAQDEIERLATIAERERIARDLHDLLGHTLSTITLKSELAAKLLDRDKERAAKEIADVERISRDALSQVREAVRGYRSSGLEGELANAKLALEAAGIAFDYYFESLDLPPTAEGVLALALREGVTNVVRHSGATSAQVRIESRGGQAFLVVTDDGTLHTSDPQDAGGLSAMRSRVEALAGNVSLRRVGKSTVLEVRLPLHRTVEETAALPAHEARATV